MRAEDDLTYQEYKDRVHDAMNLMAGHRDRSQTG